LDELMEILREARRRGYAENIDETALGLHCLAAPVGAPGRVVAAITLCVPSGRMNAPRRREMLPDLLRAASEIAPQPGSATNDADPDAGSRASNGDAEAGANAALDGGTGPTESTSLNQSSKLAALGASITRKRGRRRPDPKRKVAQ
jgi:hypothetical protein